MKLVCFIAIELFFAAELFIYENSFHTWVLHFRLFSINFEYIYSIKMVMKKNVTIIISTIIECAIMKCRGYENRTKQNQPNLTNPNHIYPNLT